MFKKKPKPILTPSQQEIKSHQEALQYFLRNQTSLGLSGSSSDLRKTGNAIEFFAYKDFGGSAELAKNLKDAMSLIGMISDPTFTWTQERRDLLKECFSKYIRVLEEHDK